MRDRPFLKAAAPPSWSDPSLELKLLSSSRVFFLSEISYYRSDEPPSTTLIFPPVGLELRKAFEMNFSSSSRM